MDYTDTLVDLARHTGHSEAEIKRMRRRLRLHTWLTAPMLAIGLLCWCILIASVLQV